MVRRKQTNETHRIVWRISSTAPAGEYVAPGEKAVEAVPVVAEPPENNWLASSLELRDGAWVSETPMDTLPGDLIDEFFRDKS